MGNSQIKNKLKRFNLENNLKKRSRSSLALLILKTNETKCRLSLFAHLKNKIIIFKEEIFHKFWHKTQLEDFVCQTRDILSAFFPNKGGRSRQFISSPLPPSRQQPCLCTTCGASFLNNVYCTFKCECIAINRLRLIYSVVWFLNLSIRLLRGCKVRSPPLQHPQQYDFFHKVR